MLPLLVVASLSLNLFPARVPLSGRIGRAVRSRSARGLQLGSLRHDAALDLLGLSGRAVAQRDDRDRARSAHGRADRRDRERARGRPGGAPRALVDGPRRPRIAAPPRVGAVRPRRPARHDLPDDLASPSVDPLGPVLVLRAERSYAEEGDDAPPIPPYIGPSLEESTEVVTLARMAHADLLDDARSWARRRSRGCEGHAGPTRPFAEWATRVAPEGAARVAAARRDYRRDVAARAAAHLLGDAAELRNATPEGGLEDAEELPADVVAPVDDAEDAVDGGAP